MLRMCLEIGRSVSRLTPFLILVAVPFPFALLSAHETAYGEAESPALPSVESLRSALAELTPKYPVPSHPQVFAIEGDYAAADLLGFDISQFGRPQSGTIPEVQVGHPFRFTAYWRAFGAMPPESRIHMRIEGSGPTLNVDEDAGAGNWDVGAVCKRSYEFKLRWLGYSGEGRVFISLRWKDEQDGEIMEREAILYAGPILVRPVAMRSTISPAKLRSFFGEDAVPLNAALRLGKGASVRIAVPKHKAVASASLGIVSAVAYQTETPNEAPICRIDFLDKTGASVATQFLVYGVSTFRADIDLYSPGAALASDVEIFSSTDSTRTDEDGATLQHHLYAGRVLLPKDVQVEQLKISYLPEKGIVDIGEIVLMRGKGGSR